MQHLLSEGSEAGDLKRLVHPELHIDEFKSKLGRDEDVCVISFKVTGKEPANDLVNFIEKGYNWVIDADVSSGEMDDGDYIVFVEAERNREIAENVYRLLEDVLHLTEQEMSEWRVAYYKDTQFQTPSVEVLQSMIPTSPEEYDRKYGKPEEDDGHEEIDKLKAAAGVKVETRAPKNAYTESLRIAAGIR